MLDQLFPYVIGFCVVVMIVIRVIRMRKKGAAAVKWEVLFLLSYGFMAGFMMAFLLNHADLGMGIMAIFAAFIVGFFFRALPLFRLISYVEKKAEEHGIK